MYDSEDELVDTTRCIVPDNSTSTLEMRSVGLSLPLKRYLRTGNVPQVNTDRGQRKFEERYQDDYVIEGDHIVYEPLNLE
jgi:hypothetical protein